MRKLCAFVYKKTYTLDGSHDVQHMRCVVDNVERILSSGMVHEPEFDRDQIRFLSIIVAWMHDVCDPKYKSMKTEELFEFLQDMFQPHIACIVYDASKHISFSRLRRQGIPSLPLLTFIVWKIASEADMLEAMGITGVIRTVMYQGAIQKTMHDAIIYADTYLTQCITYIDYSKKEAHKRLKHMRWLIHAVMCKKNEHHEKITKLMFTCHAFGRIGFSFPYVIQHVFECLEYPTHVRNLLKYEQKRLLSEIRAM